MTQEDRDAWVGFKAVVTTKVPQEQYKLLCTLHARYYNHRYHEPCSCRPKEIIMWIKDIDRIYNKI
jgi:hypothetical protein|tara:strand:+ start:196 stop:393 length:198 start_codon:yes stop_codon:yes gene_type:complete